MADPLPTAAYRWATLTPDDSSGALYIVVFLGLTYTSLTVLARVVIKRNMLGVDDKTMVVAQASNIVQYTLLLSSLSAGLAKSYHTITDDQYSRMAKTQLAGQVFVHLTLGLSKIATILIVRRLFTDDMKQPWIVCNIVTGLTIAWTILSTILIPAGCSAASMSPKNYSQSCSGIETRYLVVTSTDALTDILLAITPAYLVRRLNMSMWFKLQVLGIFALRLPLIVLSTLFFKAWKHSLHSADPGVARTAPLVFQQSQLCLSIIVGTIPSLKAFLQSFDTGSGVKAGFGYSSNSGGYGHGSGGRHSLAPLSPGASGSYQMTRFQRDGPDTLQDLTGKDGGTPRVSKKLHSRKARQMSIDDSREFARSSSHESDGRSHTSTQELFIRKDVQWEVTSEAARKGSDINRPGLLKLPM